MIRVCLFLILSILFIGYLNGLDIDACTERGHSLEVCYATINP